MWHVYCNIMCIFQCTEIIKEVETNGENLTCLLMSGADTLEPNVLNRALIAATRNDNNFNAGKLIVKGAMNLEECLKIAKEERKPNVRAMILLVKAAVSGNKAIVQKVFGETVEHLENPSDYTDDGFIDVQKAILSRQVSTVVPIEIARRNGQAAVREELLMHTDVEKDEGYVHWHGLRLLRLDISWLRKILWVKKLRLARNGFKSLPPEMGAYLKQVCVCVCLLERLHGWVGVFACVYMCVPVFHITLMLYFVPLHVYQVCTVMSI